LTDNFDGLSFYKLISSRSKNLVSERGKVFFEVGHDQSEQVLKILETNGFHNVKIVKDYQNIDRVVYGELK